MVYNERMAIKLLTDIKNLAGKRVLLRVDFNVPIERGKIKDDFKIVQSLPTIKYLLQHKAKVILVSHLGRPQGKPVSSLSLRPIAKRLEQLLKKKLYFLDTSTLRNGWKDVQVEASHLLPGSLLFLENIRFFPGEEKDSRAFSKQLATLADLFVLDGFAVAHRKAASVSGVARYLPSCAGFLLAKEYEMLSQVITKPKRPLVMIMGGVKLETKIPIIDHLLPLVDHILLGGGIANTYLWAQGYSVGNSIIDRKFKKKMVYYGHNKKIIAPVDVVVGTAQGKKAKIISVDQIGKLSSGEGMFDVGPKTSQLYANYIAGAKLVFWNGALGYFEKSVYQKGTFSLAQTLAKHSKVVRICGGGETGEVLKKLKILTRIDFVSTGGGALLEFLSGKKLPGIEAVKK